MTVIIRTARSDDAELLSSLALRSKGYWGYSPEFLEACRSELTYTPAHCDSGDVFVAERETNVLGFAAIDVTSPDGELQALFVDVGAMGQGIGGQLPDHAMRAARERGATSLVLEADPGAEDFYARNGAVPIGEAPSGSIPGRTLPVLRFDLG